MKEQIPNNELMEFEGCVHSPFWEETEKVNTDVARFVGCSNQRSSPRSRQGRSSTRSV
jgi:hypothetical protein